MTHVLKMFELANQNRVTKMQIGRGGIEAGFHLEGLAGFERFFQTLAQFLLANNFHRALL